MFFLLILFFLGEAVKKSPRLRRFKSDRD